MLYEMVIVMIHTQFRGASFHKPHGLTNLKMEKNVGPRKKQKNQSERNEMKGKVGRDAESVIPEIEIFHGNQ